MSLLKDLEHKLLIGDGAMGTLLYSYGIDQCFEALNLSHPEEVLNVHQAYVHAGSDVIQTNTYGANYSKLSRYGLEDLVKEINKEGVKLARKAATDSTYVLGTIGGIRGINTRSTPLDEIKRSFREQLYCLLLEGVDGLLLETYYDLEEILTVLKIARKETDLPLIAQVSMHEPGILQDGTSLATALKQLENAGADVTGVNCRLGPYHMIQSLEQVPLSGRFLSAYPNASLPDYEEGRLVYPTAPDYFKQSAEALRQQGVRLIGGCCGTTPEHIAAAANALKGLEPITTKKVTVNEKETRIINFEEDRLPHLHEIAKKQRSVIVELDPPKKLSIDKYLEGTKALQEVGVDAITLADNSLASPRICNTAMASMIKSQHNVRPLVHVACRDRNLIGLQSHLMGLHTLGINQVLAVTGDPTKIGDFPGATSVYDVSSFDLIRLMKQFNQGRSFSGKSLGIKTSFSIAAAFNPNVRHLDRAVERLEKKQQCGADYFISQPIYNEEQLREVYEATKHLTCPIYIGIMPLTSYRNAEFLHNEVPGIKLSDSIRNHMLHAKDSTQSIEAGLAIAKSLIDAAFDLFNGIYLITPFLRYELTVELTRYINEKTRLEEERKIRNGLHLI